MSKRSTSQCNVVHQFTFGAPMQVDRTIHLFQKAKHTALLLPATSYQECFMHDRYAQPQEQACNIQGEIKRMLFARVLAKSEVRWTSPEKLCTTMITLALGRGSNANVCAHCLLPNAIQMQDLKLCAPSQCTLLLSATFNYCACCCADRQETVRTTTAIEMSPLAVFCKVLQHSTLNSSS